MTFAIQYADGSYARFRHASENAAKRALLRRKQVGSSVVWLNEAGVPKVWFYAWTAEGLQKTLPELAKQATG